MVCEGGEFGGWWFCVVDVTVNSLSRGEGWGGADRNKSLLSCDVLVLNYEWIGWEFVCVMEWVGGGGVWMIDCRR